MLKIVFGIPTYCGSETICDTLKSIITQVKVDGIEYSILISDNNSSDNVIEKATSFLNSNNFSDFEIISNTNYDNSFDGNIINLYLNFKGDYIWLLSDDDSLSSKFSLKSFAKLISETNTDVFVSNYEECDSNLNIIEPRIRKDEINNLVTTDVNLWLKSTRLNFGLVSTLVFKKNCLNINQLFEFYGLGSIHIGMAIMGASNGIAQSTELRLVRMRSGNTSWGKDGTFAISFLNISEIIYKCYMLKYLDKYGMKFAQNIFFIDNWYRIIKSKIEGLNYNRLIFFKQFIFYSYFLRFWVFDIVLLIIPCKVFKLIYKIFIPNDTNFHN